MQKVIKYMQKLEKKYKDNDYVSTRDSIVFGVLIIQRHKIIQNMLKQPKKEEKTQKKL